eukprot:Cvel_31367.t1-p1 / transcript=Cvel_31367.t1 / gene=Cvel_31367 / organism=Chromera_velia_CCMP2878 / gene_product=Pumilio domain-containing protein C6G9.14, putative / transcript_product=Pumilio domain-containing protein C6G9.14, putative / location=Cvel_scaffold4661:1-8225(-) / protein_length=1409 / sequence_SO=supercontig / SO=protein_coding / is_pseudo=false
MDSRPTPLPPQPSSSSSAASAAASAMGGGRLSSACASGSASAAAAAAATGGPLPGQPFSPGQQHLSAQMVLDLILQHSSSSPNTTFQRLHGGFSPPNLHGAFSPPSAASTPPFHPMTSPSGGQIPPGAVAGGQGINMQRYSGSVSPLPAAALQPLQNLQATPPTSSPLLNYAMPSAAGLPLSQLNVGAGGQPLAASDPGGGGTGGQHQQQQGTSRQQLGELQQQQPHAVSSASPNASPLPSPSSMAYPFVPSPGQSSIQAGGNPDLLSQTALLIQSLLSSPSLPPQSNPAGPGMPTGLSMPGPALAASTGVNSVPQSPPHLHSPLQAASPIQAPSSPPSVLQSISSLTGLLPPNPNNQPSSSVQQPPQAMQPLSLSPAALNTNPSQPGMQQPQAQQPTGPYGLSPLDAQVLLQMGLQRGVSPPSSPPSPSPLPGASMQQQLSGAVPFSAVQQASLSQQQLGSMHGAGVPLGRNSGGPAPFPMNFPQQDASSLGASAQSQPPMQQHQPHPHHSAVMSTAASPHGPFPFHPSTGPHQTGTSLSQAPTQTTAESQGASGGMQGGGVQSLSPPSAPSAASAAPAPFQAQHHYQQQSLASLLSSMQQQSQAAHSNKGSHRQQMLVSGKGGVGGDHTQGVERDVHGERGGNSAVRSNSPSHESAAPSLRALSQSQHSHKASNASGGGLREDGEDRNHSSSSRRLGAGNSPPSASASADRERLNGSGQAGAAGAGRGQGRGSPTNKRERERGYGAGPGAGTAREGGAGAGAGGGGTGGGPYGALHGVSVEEWVLRGNYRGLVNVIARDQGGCRLLQRRLDEREAYAEQFQIITEEVTEHVVELMTDPFGNYLCQKLIDVCDHETLGRILDGVAPSLLRVSLNMHGTRAAQKLIESLQSPEHIKRMTDHLSPHVVTLVKDLNGNHVVQRCLTAMKPPLNQFIFDAMTKNCVEVATHRHGCCVLQRCIDHATPGQKASLVEEVVRHALPLVQDAFGNYVVQYVVNLRDSEVNTRLIAKLGGNIAELAKQKFASNVIEKCLQLAATQSKGDMIQELTTTSSEGIRDLMMDAYGNYVLQKAISVAEEPLFSKLLDCVRPHMAALRQTHHGKRIAAKLVKRFPQLSPSHPASQKALSHPGGGAGGGGGGREHFVGSGGDRGGRRGVPQGPGGGGGGGWGDGHVISRGDHLQPGLIGGVPGGLPNGRGGSAETALMDILQDDGGGIFDGMSAGVGARGQRGGGAQTGVFGGRGGGPGRPFGAQQHSQQRQQPGPMQGLGPGMLSQPGQRVPFGMGSDEMYVGDERGGMRGGMRGGKGPGPGRGSMMTTSGPGGRMMDDQPGMMPPMMPHQAPQAAAVSSSRGAHRDGAGEDFFGPSAGNGPGSSAGGGGVGGFWDGGGVHHRGGMGGGLSGPAGGRGVGPNL